MSTMSKIATFAIATGVLGFSAAGVLAQADQQAPDDVTPGSYELCLMGRDIVPDASFSADVSIVWRPPASSGRSEQRATARYFRDRAGRVRVEQGTVGGGRTPTRVFLSPLDGTGQVYVADSDLQTVIVSLRGISNMMIGGGCQYAFALPFVNQPGGRSPSGFVSFFQYPNQPESLGERTIEGIPASGTRFMPSNPLAPGIYDDRRSERWVSPDLKLVLSLHSEEPEMGSFEYQLSRISRAEPSADLFEAPADCDAYQHTEQGRPFRCDGDAARNLSSVGPWMAPKTFLENYRAP